MVRQGGALRAAVIAVLRELLDERPRGSLVDQHGHVDGDLLAAPLADVAGEGGEARVGREDDLLRDEERLRGAGRRRRVARRLGEHAAAQPVETHGGGGGQRQVRQMHG